MKFLHAADIHLDSPLCGLTRYAEAPVDAIRGATRRAFENLVATALAEPVDLVLLAGDLYDGDWKDYNTGLFFTARMARLHEAGIPVLVIAGNHDAASQLTRALRPPPNCRWLATDAPETVAFEHLGVAVHGQGFATRAVTTDLTRAYPAPCPGLCNIGLLHTSLDGRPGHEPYAPCTPDGLRTRGYQYWALGHVHAHEVVARDPWVVFPGATQGRHARETGPKGCCLVEVEDGEVRRLERRPLDVVRWADCRVDLTGVTGTAQLYDRVGLALARAAGAAEGRLAAVRLRLCGVCGVHARLRADPEQVVNECRALALGVGDLWLEKVLIETRDARPATGTPAADDALGGLLRALGDLELNAARCADLAGEFEDLRTRLPAELRGGAEPFDPADPDTLRACLEDVKDLLVERLLDASPERRGGP